MRSFNELLELHREIDGLFAAHQFALLHFEFEKALGSLTAYTAALLRHMVDEEEHMLPLYAERATIERGGAVQLFTDDHEKMRGFVELFGEQTAALAKDTEPESRLLQLLDREAFYKRLCSHHDNRESSILYPALDTITSAVEREDILSRVMCRLGR